MDLVIIPPAFANNIDGIEFVLVKERARALSRFFDSITVISGSEKEILEGNIKYISLKLNGKLNSIKYFICLRKLLKKSKNTIILNYCPFLPGIFSVIAARSSGVKSCTNFIGAPEAYASCVSSLSYKILLMLSSSVITTSEFLSERLRNVHNREIRIVYNSVRPGFRKIRTKKIKNSVLYVGRLSKEKRVDHLLKAFSTAHSKNPTLLLYVAGDGPEKQNLHALATELNVIRNVKFLGHLDTKDVILLMNKCEVFVLPTRYEGFGMVAIEAMRCGTPVIAMKSGGPVTVVGDAGILVEPDDVSELSGCILRLFSKRSEIKRLSEKGIRRSMDFDYETWGSRLFEAMVK